jgi:hypothetical protein
MIKNLLMLLIATAVISGCTTIYEQPDPILGQWKFTFSDLPQGDPEGLLAIAKVEGVYSGTIANSTGEYELKDLLIEENDLVGSSFNYQGNTIGHYRQMFIDDFLIAESDNITRRICPVEKSPLNPIVRPEKAWEGRTAVPQGSVIYDEEEDIYKMWYTTDIQSKGKGLAYCTSNDGIHWVKPEMGIVVRDGVKTNLLIPALTFGYMYQPYFVLKDNKESDPQRRYKLAFLSIQRGLERDKAATHPGTRRGLGIAFSPDGLHWTKVRDFASDDIIDISHIMVDPYNDDEYVIYGRTLKVLPEIRQAWGHHDWFEKDYVGRAVIRSVSDDFLNWAPADFVMGPDLEDPVSTQIYSMNVFPYEGLYLGLAQRYISKPGIGTLDIQLAISRDGIHFERPFREPLFPLGGIGSWDRFMLHSMSGPPLSHGDELRFYYGGRNSRHRPTKIADAANPPEGNIGLATMLRDRFVAVEASFDGGTLITKPLHFDGSTLSVNCNTAFGKLGIRLLDRNGDPLEGYQATVEGVDLVEHAVQFDKPLGPLRSQGIRIKFSLYNAQLYSFSVK